MKIDENLLGVVGTGLSTTELKTLRQLIELTLENSLTSENAEREVVVNLDPAGDQRVGNKVVSAYAMYFEYAGE